MNYINRPEPALKQGHAEGTRRTLEERPQEQPLYQPRYQPGAAPGSAQNRRDGSGVFCGGRTRCSRSGPGIYRTPGFETHIQSARAHYRSPPGCDFPCPPNQCDRGSDRRRQTRALGVRADWYAEPARPGSAADQTSPGWLDCARQINRINPPTSGMNGAAPSAYSVDFLDMFGAGAHKGNKDSRIFSNPYS
uniref:Uncharacterized protein n=1 Tax=Knipowitschia caucasica TaxID=637954 RepID=A0AAV2M705_KNICA